MKETKVDAIVIGAGFGGLYALHKLRNILGLNAKILEKGTAVGGVWHWNRYPGAKCDTESHVYRYSFDKDTPKKLGWNSRYIDQPQMQLYLEAIAERYNLVSSIKLSTTVVSCEWSSVEHLWTIETFKGETFKCRYLITALGALSSSVLPQIKGLDNFRGSIVHTSDWPKDLDLRDLRVGVVGTGSTGAQVITAIAPIVKHLTVFQRSAQFIVPAGDSSLTAEQLEVDDTNFEEFWDFNRNTRVACGFSESNISAMSVDEDTRRKIFEEYWRRGNGFKFMFETFGDIVSNPEANKAARDFINEKIDQIVADRKTAELLKPKQLYAKRPVACNDYYETFNRSNVSLVDISVNAFKSADGSRIIMSSGEEYSLDVLICATGFDAVEGSYKKINIKADTYSLSDHWSNTPRSSYGITISNFPNLFMVYGPFSVFSNLACGIEAQVDYISDIILYNENLDTDVMATSSAEDDWRELCNQLAEYTLFPKVKSWIFGGNVKGENRDVLFYFGGLGEYRKLLKESRQNSFPELLFTSREKGA